MKPLLCLLLLCGPAAFAADPYPLGPDSLPQAGVPQGIVTHGVLPPGAYYPGTPHAYSVYAPAHWQADQPLPYMVFLDGNGALRAYHLQAVFDNLIARHALPPLVGIFVDPGVLPTTSAQAQHRYERIFEYDSTSARFARFLIDELIPEVAKHYPLSQDPNAHGIGGSSTGAVGAFVAAWQRPDQFRRVLTLIGTFVDMKGAEELPSLIRKTEPKPIRILMQDGRNDHLVEGEPWGINFGGSWPINNEVLYEAFEFAGYDAKFVLGEGAHDTFQSAAMMPEALQWLWANYPQPVTAHEPIAMQLPHYEPRGRVYSIVAASQPWTPASGTDQTVLNATSDRAGNVYFADQRSQKIYQLDAAGAVSVFRADGGGATLLRCGPSDRLYAAQPARQRLVAFGPDGSQQVLATGVDLDDFVVTARGDIYFIAAGTHRLGLIRADGRLLPAYVGEALAAPAGLTLSPDQAMLVVADAATRYGWSFQIAADGTLINGEPYYRLYVPELAAGSGVSRVTVDALGQVYFASALGVQVTEQNGRVAAVLNAPHFGAVSSVTFGGPDFAALYVTEAGRLYRRPTKVHGVAPWAPVVPPKPPL